MAPRPVGLRPARPLASLLARYIPQRVCASPADLAYSSRLLRIEAFRTVDRLRLGGVVSDQEVAQLAREIQIVCDTLYITPLDESILRRAGESFPTTLGTLDALHLATALAIKKNEDVDFLLTHDEQLGTAARVLGFEVIGIR